MTGTLDDYGVLVLQNLDDFVFTAAALDLEGFLVFYGGDNQRWTSSNLRILDFEPWLAGGDDTFILGQTGVPTVFDGGPGTLDGFAGTATGIGTGFDNISLLVGASADQSVVKTGPATAFVGTPIAFTTTVANAAPAPALDAALTDILPTGTTFASLASPAGWSCATPAVIGTGTVTCTATLAVGTLLPAVASRAILRSSEGERPFPVPAP